MSRPLLIISVLFMLLAPVVSFPETGRPKAKGPITVTSETLTADNRAHTALFEKNVIVKTSDMTMAADSMLIYYKEGGGEVTKIEASGNVRLFRETRAITARNAVYFAEEEKVVFTGDPRAMDGDNVLTGSKMTYHIKDDRSYIENSKVFLKNRQDR